MVEKLSFVFSIHFITEAQSALQPRSQFGRRFLLYLYFPVWFLRLLGLLTYLDIIRIPNGGLWWWLGIGLSMVNNLLDLTDISGRILQYWSQIFQWYFMHHLRLWWPILIIKINVSCRLLWYMQYSLIIQFQYWESLSQNIIIILSLIVF